MAQSFSIFGHRGWPTRYPDNTLAGFMAAATVADGIETDIRRSADGKLILSHDPEIGGLRVDSNAWDTLGEVDLGGGHRPVLLDECLASLPDFPVMLEVKNMVHEPGFEPDHRLALEVASRARPTDMLTSFHWPTVDAVRRQFPEVTTGVIVGKEARLEDAIEHCLAVGHRLLASEWSLLTEGAVDLSETVLQVFAWTVNDPALASELAAAGVTGIITDDPGLIAAARDAA
jgi:glycerophosphoryl diester phosphodiesterase